MTTAVFLAASSAFANKPAVQREFSDIASRGCNNRDGKFTVRGMVSNAKENAGEFTKGRYEASAERLNELRASLSPVLPTSECKGDGTPIAINLSYENSDRSISF